MTMFPLELQAVLLRLTAVTPSGAVFLVPLHAGSELDVDSGRGGKSKAFGDFYQVEFVDVENGA